MTKEARRKTYIANHTLRLSILLWNWFDLYQTKFDQIEWMRSSQIFCISICAATQKCKADENLMWEAKKEQNNAEIKKKYTSTSVNIKRFRINRTFPFYRIAESGVAFISTDETMVNQNTKWNGQGNKFNNDITYIINYKSEKKKPNTHIWCWFKSSFRLQCVIKISP